MSEWVGKISAHTDSRRGRRVLTHWRVTEGRSEAEREKERERKLNIGVTSICRKKCDRQLQTWEKSSTHWVRDRVKDKPLCSWVQTCHIRREFPSSSKPSRSLYFSMSKLRWGWGGGLPGQQPHHGDSSESRCCFLLPRCCSPTFSSCWRPAGARTAQQPRGK